MKLVIGMMSYNKSSEHFEMTQCENNKRVYLASPSFGVFIRLNSDAKSFNVADIIMSVLIISGSSVADICQF